MLIPARLLTGCGAWSPAVILHSLHRKRGETYEFEELDKILTHYGFIRRQASGGTSHYYYTKGEKVISVPFRQPHIKTTYVERAIELLEGEINDDEQES